MKTEAMNKQVTQLAWGVLLVAAGSNCIAPQTPQGQCPTGGTSSATASTTSASTTSAPSTKGSSAPTAVKPTGLLLSDGASDKIQSVDPPGSWFVFNDRSAKGTMTPASTGEFGATGIVKGAIHSQGKGF